MCIVEDVDAQVKLSCSFCWGCTRKPLSTNRLPGRRWPYQHHTPNRTVYSAFLMSLVMASPKNHASLSPLMESR